MWLRGVSPFPQNRLRELNRINEYPAESFWNKKTMFFICHGDLSGSGDSGMVATSQKKFDNFENHGAGFFHGDSHTLNTLGLKLIAGRHFSEDEVIYSAGKPVIKSVIITQSLANKLFPKGNALGKQLFLGGNDQVTIVGIVEQMSGSWVHSSMFEDNMITPFVPLYTFKRILIRAENKATADKLLGEVENILIKRNPERVINAIRSLQELRTRSYFGDSAMTTILWIVIILLVLITAFGIVGTVSFNVNQRTKQIGTRRALGARKVDIQRYFLTENFLISNEPNSGN